jgi:branched-chain amino acid aminotransferase
MTEHIWLDDTLYPAGAPVPAAGLLQSLIHSRGVYETIKVDGGALRHFDAHCRRLRDGCDRLGLVTPEHDTLTSAAAAVLQANALHDARLRINVTGTGPCCSVLITAKSLNPLPSAQSLHTVRWRRNEHSPLAGIKYTACPENDLALEAARAAGADEALFLNTRGEVCEGAYSNVFAVIRGAVITPPAEAGCLPGIMRAQVLDLCQHHSIPAKVRPLRPEELTSPECTELFVTSSIRGVMPVHRLDARLFAEHRPVTGQLARLVHP